MVNYKNSHFEKMLELNKEYTIASPNRRKQIEQEIIAMVPKEYTEPSEEISELTRLQEELKDRINKLTKCTKKVDFQLYFKELDELDHKICAHAKRLGADLPRTDYGKIMAKLLENRFGN